jgi:hypothetical protein
MALKTLPCAIALACDPPSDLSPSVSGPNPEVLLKSSIMKLESYLSLLINYFTTCFSLQHTQLFLAPRPMHFAIAIFLAVIINSK